jgi:hypothetical protein
MICCSFIEYQAIGDHKANDPVTCYLPLLPTDVAVRECESSLPNFSYRESFRRAAKPYSLPSGVRDNLIYDDRMLFYCRRSESLTPVVNEGDLHESDEAENICASDVPPGGFCGGLFTP